MPYLIRSQQLDAAQREIVVLRAFVTFAKTADLAQKRRSINSEVIDVILPEEKLGIPIRLEERVRARAVMVDLVFVRIDEPGIGMRHDFQSDKGERVFGKRIILIEQRAPLAGSQRQR